jgi:hypothetical protein
MRQIVRLVFSSVFISATVFGQAGPNPTRPMGTDVRVPFVGCNSDGQAGPLDAPSRQSENVKIPTWSAARLAYYKARDGFGVLAPRGWYCFATYGSNGGSLYVSPHPISATLLFSSDWKGFTGPVIQLSDSIGDTSGRFEVAAMIARVFPAYSWFLKNVIGEGIKPASAFPRGPYPKDKLIYRSKELVEFQTPANEEGLGTASRLLKADTPIYGLAMLVGQTPDLVQLSMRVTPETVDLIPIIFQQLEIEGRADARDDR